MFSRDHLRAKVLPQLRACVPARRRVAPGRPVPVTVYALLDALRDDGLALVEMRGPWRAGQVETSPWRLGSGAHRACIELGSLRLAVQSEKRAQELAGLLNWCEIEPSDLGWG